MRKCKYCGRELKGNERCTCPGAMAMRRKVRMISIIAGVLVIAVIIVAIVVGTSSRTSTNNPSSETTIQESSVPATEPFESENTSTMEETAVEDITITTSEETAAEDATTTIPDETESEEITSADPANLIDPFEHLITDPVYEKYNGMGTATIERDNETLLDALKPSEEDWDAYVEYFNNRDEYEAAVRNICVEVSPNNDLSNGDEITVTVTIPEFLADKVMSTSKTFVVSGLPDIQKVDILSMFDFRAKGVSGEAKIVVHPVTEDEYLLEGLLLIEPREHLSSGDTYTITITDDYCEYLIKYHGIKPSSTTVTRMVESLPEYVTSADQLPMDEISGIAAQYLADIEASYDGGGILTAESFKLEGIYLVINQENTPPHIPDNLRLIIEVSYIQHSILGDSEIIRLCWAITKDKLTVKPGEVASISKESGSDISPTIEDLNEYYVITKIG